MTEHLDELRDYIRTDNHVAACFACNQAKGDMTGIAFILLRKRREEEDA